MKFGLTERAIALIISALRQFPSIEEARIYGSRAKGDFRHNSDIDLALFGPVTFTDMLRVRGQLDELPLPHKFDVTPMASLTHPGLRAHIERVWQILYSRAVHEVESP